MIETFHIPSRREILAGERGTTLEISWTIFQCFVPRAHDASRGTWIVGCKETATDNSDMLGNGGVSNYSIKIVSKELRLCLGRKS